MPCYMTEKDGTCLEYLEMQQRIRKLEAKVAKLTQLGNEIVDQLDDCRKAYARLALLPGEE